MIASLYRDEFFADKMEADDFGTRFLFEMTDHRVANHLVELFQRVGHGKNRLAQRFRGVAPLGRLAHDEDDFVHVRPPKIKTAGEPDRPTGGWNFLALTRPAIPRRYLPGGRRRTAAAAPRRSRGWSPAAPRSASPPPRPRPRS